MKSKDVFQYGLAALVIGGWLLMFYRLFLSPIPPENLRLADMMFGSLCTAAIMVLGFFFGTNKESAAKTEMIFKSTPPKPEEVNPGVNS